MSQVWTGYSIQNLPQGVLGTNNVGLKETPVAKNLVSGLSMSPAVAYHMNVKTIRFNSKTKRRMNSRVQRLMYYIDSSSVIAVMAYLYSKIVNS